MAKRLKNDMDRVEGVEGVLYRVLETLPIEVLNQMRASPKDDAIPEITMAELTAADGVLFGFPMRYGSM
ncbi:putative NAD(P)H dehydrogenase (quinone) FQR1-like 2, partial [Glycine soja]